MKKTAFALACLCLAAPAQARIEKAPWGESPDHQKVDIYTLTNQHGMSARITNYGAFLVSLNVPDKTGKMADVVVWNRNPFSVYALANLVFVDGVVRYDRQNPDVAPESDFLIGQPAAPGVDR